MTCVAEDVGDVGMGVPEMLGVDPAGVQLDLAVQQVAYGVEAVSGDQSLHAVVMVPSQFMCGGRNAVVQLGLHMTENTTALGQVDIRCRPLRTARHPLGHGGTDIGVPRDRIPVEGQGAYSAAERSATAASEALRDCGSSHEPLHVAVLRIL